MSRIYISLANYATKKIKAEKQKLVIVQAPQFFMEVICAQMGRMLYQRRLVLELITIFYLQEI